MFTSLLRTTEKEQKALHDEWLKTAIEYKSDWEHTLERRKAHGIVAPDPIPHPDDIIIINMRTGEVHIKGPMTKEEKVQWRFRQRKDARSDQPIDLAARSANFVKLDGSKTNSNQNCDGTPLRELMRHDDHASVRGLIPYCSRTL